MHDALVGLTEQFTALKSALTLFSLVVAGYTVKKIIDLFGRFIKFISCKIAMNTFEASLKAMQEALGIDDLKKRVSKISLDVHELKNSNKAEEGVMIQVLEELKKLNQK